MSVITNPSRLSKDVASTMTKVDRVTPAPKPRMMEEKLETRMNMKDLESLREAFMAEGDGYDNRLSLNREQFCEALSLILHKGTREEYGELFDKVDITKEDLVDWDKFASHMLLEFYEKDDRTKATQVPQWKDLKILPSPHKEIIQKISFLKSLNRYMGISKEGCVSMWDQNLRLQRSIKTGTDSCKQRDLWVTNFVHLPNINKIALSFTSKEIAFYDLSSKMEFNCQYKVQGLAQTPLCLDYWANPDNINEAVITWGDTGGYVNALHFNSVNIALFERPAGPAGEKQAWDEPCLNVQLKDIAHKKYKNAQFTKYQAHNDWVRQVKYSEHLECFISCSTTWNKSLVIGWMEKHTATKETKTTTFQVSQGITSFDYHEQLNQIATAGVNHHVCLWNPYVVSKPNGVLRGHMASVIQVQYNRMRSQLVSFSKDKVLRIWDVQLQVCIQRLAGMFPKGPEVMSTLYFDEVRGKLFITFNYQLTVIEMKAEVKDRVMTHDKPVIAALYNHTYNQVVTGSQEGSVTVWMVDTGQKVKNFAKLHNDAELTTLSLDHSETRLMTGSTDGTVKIWDFNSHCYHVLQCGPDGQPADVGQILNLKRSMLIVGWAKYITLFRNQNFKDYHVEPSDWKGGQEHSDDILAMAFASPNTLATGSYDGEIVIWNNNSEQASRHLKERARRLATRGRTFATTRENTMLTDRSAGSRDPTELDLASSQRSRPKSRPRSRAASKASSVGGKEETNEYGCAVTCLAFLEERMGNSASGGANLISCGGNGWVRFWNSANSTLLAEFVAHTQVGSIIMAVDKANHWLVTADTDGIVKVWDIQHYCLRQNDDGTVMTTPPRLHSQMQPHTDIINTIEMCVRNERNLILTSSSDCSAALWDIDGNIIGVFGQEGHWKIKPYIQEMDEEDMSTELDRTPDSAANETPVEDDGDKVAIEIELEDDTQWEPDQRAVQDPSNFRVNTWEQTLLGKDYQEIRVQKRERKQPHQIPDLPYLHWERTGQPPAGPFAALDTSDLQPVEMLKKPDFVQNPHKYFTQRTAADDNANKLPLLAETLKAAYDEKTLFPKYILDFEARMKNYHQKVLEDQQRKAGQNFVKAGASQGLLTPASQTPTSKSPFKGLIGGAKSNRLKPLSIKSGSVISE